MKMIGAYFWFSRRLIRDIAHRRRAAYTTAMFGSLAIIAALAWTATPARADA